jgi:hypothetical protein
MTEVCPSYEYLWPLQIGKTANAQNGATTFCQRVTLPTCHFVNQQKQNDPN